MDCLDWYCRRIPRRAKLECLPDFGTTYYLDMQIGTSGMILSRSLLLSAYASIVRTKKISHSSETAGIGARETHDGHDRLSHRNLPNFFAVVEQISVESKFLDKLMGCNSLGNLASID